MPALLPLEHLDPALVLRAAQAKPIFLARAKSNSGNHRRMRRQSMMAEECLHVPRTQQAQLCPNSQTAGTPASKGKLKRQRPARISAVFFRISSSRSHPKRISRLRGPSPGFHKSQFDLARPKLEPDLHSSPLTPLGNRRAFSLRPRSRRPSGDVAGPAQLVADQNPGPDVARSGRAPGDVPGAHEAG